MKVLYIRCTDQFHKRVLEETKYRQRFGQARPIADVARELLVERLDQLAGTRTNADDAKPRKAVRK